MPIYEEKLICPLAIRFTQDHVRPVFQDGRDLEATISAIKSKPGSGEYDVILEAPFPAIEIVRWYQRHDHGTVADAKHWCTLDNRRLCCLQRAAMALWPKRVAVVVEVLYAATEGILRKNDSSTEGLSVAIGHSPKAIVDHWDWRKSAAVSAGGAATLQAFEDLVSQDDARDCVEKLLDAPAGPSMLDRFLQAEVEKETRQPALEDSICSTAHPSSPRSLSSDHSGATSSTGSRTQVQKKQQQHYESWCEGLEGNWQGHQGEVYQVWAETETTWTCLKLEAGGSRKTYTLWYDEAGDAIWWGNNWTLYMDANEARTGPQVGWYAANSGRRPRFTWFKMDTPAAPEASHRQAKAQRGKAVRQHRRAGAAHA